MTFYNAKNNFKDLNIKEINPNKNFNIYIFLEKMKILSLRSMKIQI